MSSSLKNIIERLGTDSSQTLSADVKNLIFSADTPPTTLFNLQKIIRQHFLKDVSDLKKYHIMAHHTADYLASILEVHLWASDINSHVTCSSFGTLDSELARTDLEKDTTYLVMIDGQSIIDRSRLPSSKAMLDVWLSSLEAFATSCPGRIIWLLPDTPQDYLGSRQQKDWFSSVADHLNHIACQHGSLIDLDDLQLQMGRETWWNATLFHTSRVPFSFEAQVAVAREISRLEAHHRYPIKGLILDLDNTLWGGVLGDDGIDGIQIGPESSVDHAYREFQRHLKSLQQEGIILCISSKNDHPLVMEVLQKHPHMILREEDFACIRANWEPKSENIQQIAETLNLPVEAFVFVDDSALEIEEVKSRLPGISTLKLPDDPSQFTACLTQHVEFSTSQQTAEDKERTAYYKNEQERQKMAQSHTSYEDFLKSLNMEMSLSPLTEKNIDRVVQLFSKTNQFNLTTRRHKKADLEKLSKAEGSWFRAASLKDKLGPSGLISVLVAVPVDSSRLQIESWLMSCRVFKRQVELALFNELVAWAGSQDYSSIELDYLPTAKNANMPALFDELGFSLEDSLPDKKHYVLDIQTYTAPPHTISLSSS